MWMDNNLRQMYDVIPLDPMSDGTMDIVPEADDSLERILIQNLEKVRHSWDWENRGPEMRAI